MSIKKTVDLGEYIVTIEYDNETGSIEVSVLDELHDVIETIVITNVIGENDNKDDNDDDIDIEGFDDYNISLN
jgi:hypothetical protein